MMTSRTGVVTLGQPLAVIRTLKPGPLSRGATCELGVAGAELNVAIGVRRLGLATGWIGHVGADPLGLMIERELRAEGVRTLIRRDEDRPTALMINERRTIDHVRVSYYREDVAGAGLSARDVDRDFIAGFAHLHITGITPCLGAGPHEAVLAAVTAARDSGMTISLDANYRSRLADPTSFLQHVRPLVENAHLLFVTEQEAGHLTAGAAPDAAAAALLELGPETVVVKRGSAGSVLFTQTSRTAFPAARVTVVDTVGAGDAFAAGFLTARLRGLELTDQMLAGQRTAAINVSTQGDWDGLPMQSELAAINLGEDIER